MSDNKNEDRQQALDALKQFSEHMKQVAEAGPPPLMKQFLEAVYSLKDDDEALNVLEQEIVKHYGK